jgi:hypothetical protein
MVWFASSIMDAGELLKILLPAFAGLGLITYKKKFTKHHLYFVLKKKKFTLIHINAPKDYNHES